MSEPGHVEPERLSAYLDGDLGRNARSRVERHLDHCARCAAVLEDLEALVESAGALGDRGPERDLWPGIARAIREEGPGRGPASRPTEPAWRRRIRVSPLQAAAVILVAVGISAGGAWLAHPDGGGGGAGTEPVAEVGRAVSVPDAPGAPRGYAEEVARLERALQEARDRLDPQTVRILEKNLGVIDRAIRESRQALEVDPGNEYLEDHLERAYRIRLDYLRQATRAVAEWSS